MSKLARLDELLEQYYQLKYHTQPEILSRLQDVQAWQKARMQRTHQQHFSEKNNQLMAEYFLNRLYGGPDFDALAEQIARLMKYAHKAEKVSGGSRQFLENHRYECWRSFGLLWRSQGKGND